MKTVWSRYLTSSLLKTLLLFFLFAFILYVLMDLSAHGVRFFSHGANSLLKLILFYFQSFSLHLSLIAPIVFLLASFKVLFYLVRYRELVALQMGGLSKQTLLRPFLTIACLLSLILYANSQWYTPIAAHAVKTFRRVHSDKQGKKPINHLYHFSLEDGSEIIYQRFDPEQNRLFDLFWVRSFEEIWHAKWLDMTETVPQGHFVLKTEKSSPEFFEQRAFPEMQWNSSFSLGEKIPYDERPLSTLWEEAKGNLAERNPIRATLHQKLAAPLLPLLLLVLFAPFAMRYGRNRPFVAIASLGLFSAVGSLMILDGMVILGENGVLSPFLAVWTPLCCLGGFSIHSFAKMKF